MTLPSRHDFNIDRSSCHGQPGQRSNLPSSAGSSFDDEYTRFMNGLAVAVFLIVLITAGAVLFHHFLAAVPAISRVVTGGK